MPIENTVRLSVDNIALMNTGMRRIGYGGTLARGPGVANGLITDDEIIGEPKPPGPDRQGRRVGLAEYFGVLPLSVVAWLVPDNGTSYPNPRACVTVRDGRIGNNAPYVGALGRRLYCLAPELLEGKTDPLNNLRQRIFLAACLGVDGGLQRIPIYTGPTRERRWGYGMLSSCLETILTEWSGRDNFFAERAWTQFTIFGRPGNWTLSMYYNEIDPATDVSDKMEVEDDSQDDGAPPGCP